ncbi:hypothetical protein AB0F03_35530 [Streptomyces sp. NPDC028722]|uniref:hypothetical protein n=1 Tax=Streptomyces sp. NPDC028722 TaxID=3155016 RepID=UPI0034045F50
MPETGVPYSADQHRTSRRPQGGPWPDTRACGDVIGVVLAGAPGAGEAGLLSVMDSCGQRTLVFVGTGAGAVHAMLYDDSPAHLSERRTVATAVELWRGLPGGLQRPGPALTGPLDTAPLPSTLHDRPDRQHRHETALAGKVRATAAAATVCRTTRTGKYLLQKADRRTEPAPSLQDTMAEVCQAVLTGRIVEGLRALSRTGAPVESGVPAKSPAGRHRCAAPEASGRRAGHRSSGTGSDPASTRPSNSADATPNASAATRTAAVSGTSRHSRHSRRESGAEARAS